VIGADGSLTGYAAGVERKAWLLRHESARSDSPSFIEQPRLLSVDDDAVVRLSERVPLQATS
jgi:hypothetical protein